MTIIGLNRRKAPVFNSFSVLFLLLLFAGCSKMRTNSPHQDFSGKPQEPLPGKNAVEKHISSDTSKLEFKILLDAHEKLLPDAPCQLYFNSENPVVLRFEQQVVRKLSDKIDVPMKVAFGKTIIFIKGSFYYCTAGDIEQCRRKVLDLHIPINVSNKGGKRLMVTTRLSEGPENDGPTTNRKMRIK
jgi:hypothetical protein